MSAIALCSMKGGTGKTTLALNLAERAHASGLRVAVIDFDPQEGAISLLDLRADRESAWPVFASRVNVAGAKSLASMKSGGEYDLLVCDLPGSDSMALGRLLMEMDLILSPVGVSAVEIMVAANFASIVERLNLPVVLFRTTYPRDGCAMRKCSRNWPSFPMMSAQLQYSIGWRTWTRRVWGWGSMRLSLNPLRPRRSIPFGCGWLGE